MPPYSTEAPVHPTSALCNHPNLCMPSVVLSLHGGRCVQTHPFSLSALNVNAHTLCPMRRAPWVNGVPQTSGFRGALLTREERAGFFGGELFQQRHQTRAPETPTSRDHLWLPASRAAESLTHLTLAQKGQPRKRACVCVCVWAWWKDRQTHTPRGCCLQHLVIIETWSL